MQNSLLVMLSLGGLIFSILSILENHVKWILSFCDIFGEGCRKALKFHLFGIPVSWYGAVYYIFLIILIYLMEPLIFLYVMAGFGIELTFIWIMIYIRAFCIFCTINAAMITGLFILVFDVQRVWEGVSIVLFFLMGSLYFLYRENVSELAGASETEDDLIAAKINGDVITMEDVEQPLVQPIYSLRTKIYQLKKNRLEQLIRELLIKKQAKLENKSETDLINSFLKSKAHDFDDRADEGKKEEKIIEYADSLKKKINVKVFLQPPRLPIINVPIKDDPSLGPLNALVVIVEFSDYLCPGCQKGHEIAETIKKKFKGRIRWVFKDFPLEQHEGADKMAEAAHCAHDQGKFWQYQDILFSMGKKTGSEELIQCAKNLGLDVAKFKQCIDNQRYRPKVQENIRVGKKIGIASTPTFVINGQMLSGVPSPEKFEELIEEAFRKANSLNTSER